MGVDARQLLQLGLQLPRQPGSAGAWGEKTDKAHPRSRQFKGNNLSLFFIFCSEIFLGALQG